MRKKLRGRREFLSTLAASAGVAPLWAHTQPQPARPAPMRPRTYPRQYSDKVMRPVSVREMEEIARSNLDYATYHYVAGGAEDEYTLRANVEAYRRVWLRRRVMVDVSEIDTSLTLLGHELESPILLSQTTKNGVVPNGDRVSAVAAHESNIIYAISNAIGWMDDLYREQKAPVWWAATLGHISKPLARNWARRRL